jgi:hypothetical protein
MNVPTWFSRLAFWHTPDPPPLAVKPKRKPFQRRPCGGCELSFAMRDDGTLMHHPEDLCIYNASIKATGNPPAPKP